MKYRLIKLESNDPMYKKGLKFRIKALKSFGSVEKGDIGGYVTSEKNLSQDGNCWVFDKAEMHNKSRLFDDAKMYDESKMYNESKMLNFAEMYDNAEMHNESEMHNNSRMCKNAALFDNAKMYDCTEISENSELRSNVELHSDTKRKNITLDIPRYIGMNYHRSIGDNNMPKYNMGYLVGSNGRRGNTYHIVADFFEDPHNDNEVIEDSIERIGE